MEIVPSEQWLRSAVGLPVRVVEAVGAVVSFSGALAAAGLLRLIGEPSWSRIAAAAAIIAIRRLVMLRAQKRKPPPSPQRRWGFV